MNPRVQAIGGSLIREIAAKRTPGCIDLGLGEPSLLPTMKYFESALRQTAERGVPYTLNAGDPALREAIAAHYLYPHYTDADNVCITTGSQEAVYVVVKALLDPAKDEMLVVEPAFPAYAKMAKLEGVTVQTVAMDAADDFAFDAARILGAVNERTRLIVICSPCNPTGRVISREAVHALSDGLKLRGGEPVYVLHDEIYREQTYTANAGHFACVYPHTVVTNSISKSNALTGLRLGWTLASKDVTAAIVKTHAWVTSCASTFAQRVALEIFNTSGALDEHAAWYREHCAGVVAALEGSGLRFIRPEGSFYACVKLPDGVKSLQAAHELADAYRVIAIPGVAFGESFEGWLRLSWVAPLDEVAQGVERIAQFCGATTASAPGS
jgi:aspartate/methionine/tyrosine aminotransferase